MSKERIAFIGTGVMGASMAGHILDAGYPLSVYNRTKSKADDLVSRGAVWCDTPGEAAANADIVITIVGYPKDVESVYFDANGIFANLKEGGVAIEMTTSSPLLALKLAKEGLEKGIGVMDAPVSGGDLGARSGRLSIMVGGRPKDFDRVKPLFDLMGGNVVYQGEAGAGQHTKMCNQIAIAGGMVSISESLAYARAAGLDPAQVLKSIEAGAAGSWSMTNLVPRALKGDYSPGFFIRHFIKDMGIAIDSAEELGLKLPAVDHAKKLYEQIAANGGEDLGTQTLFKGD